MILWHGIAATWEGDWVTCGQHSGTYRITGGVSSMFSSTKKLAGSISSISTCPCDARFIPTITDSYTDDTLSKPIKSMPYSRSFYIQSPENIKTYGVAYAIKPFHAYWKVNQAGMAIWNRYKPRNLSR
ncbi:hypothetical protein BGI40_04025 [Snodgrassella communis]|uniref:Uncharacterized protein n=2 Tax=Snodgrassella communis TaxID=2946699 RepID=A0A066THG9_9NEIS|nr:hypothetical protein SALWKB12_2173 [Snodgrassella communis]KDN14295.1 hypothetical protein SALWKB29_1597 [Snodgrassella communis]PIT10869.1 hypothetical protein BGI29_01335 [Snodgrassella communis]PIT25570.1 hypothetical protein BGI39_11225 [Snodgrassella communis]PIT30580.1 hypothetical protein BGI38_00480 [Snodgrassella communis]